MSDDNYSRPSKMANEDEESFRRRVLLDVHRNTSVNAKYMEDLEDRLEAYTTKTDKNEQRSETNRWLAGLLMVPVIGGAIALAYQSVQIRSAATSESEERVQSYREQFFERMKMRLSRENYGREELIQDIKKGEYDTRLRLLEEYERQTANRKTVLTAIQHRMTELNNLDADR